MHARPTITLLLTVLLLGACARSGAAGTGPAEPAGLDGRTFISTAIRGHDLVLGSEIRLTFSGDNLAVQAGCNSMGGTYALDGDHLTVGQMGGTDMACEPPLMDQDAWVAEFLRDVTVALDGDTLTLTRGDVTITFTDREVAEPDRDLLGTRWVLDGIIDSDAVSSVPMGVEAAVTFAGGQVSVEAGCNTGGGSVDVTEMTIVFAGIGMTKMACDGPAMAVERAMLQVLSGTVAYEIDADSLTIRTGQIGLTFKAEG